MLVVIACAVLLLAGLALIVLWGPHSLVPPAVPATTGRPMRAALRRYLERANVVMFAALVSGALVAAAGGRLAMRVLAVTSPDARGFVTEAGFVVGDITVEETIGLFVFAALPMAFLSAVAYLVVARWLPKGRLGGVVFGLLLLVVLSGLEPLRPGNPDFRIVGPGWLSVLLFGVLILLHGMLVAASAGWLSARPPVTGPRAVVRYAPLGAAVVIFPLAVVLLLGAGAAVVAAWVLPRLRRWSPSPTVVLWSGRGALALLALAFTPLFVAGIVEILQKG